jgi:site-specific DNA recombinase
VGLVTRVSTDRQARNEEGSLKNQLQRLRQYIEYRNSTCGESWREVAHYELKGVSGKNSMRSQEFERLFADIRAGQVNTIGCAALDRICRSVKDFLGFFEFLQEHKVEFVCLKQNYDTTSPQGRLFITMMMALAQFEREQTSERTRDASSARAERGLWNGGRLLGYELDTNKRGSLIPNTDEAAVVNYAFDKYLEYGSIVETTEAMNSRGYRTKSYTSYRDVYHPAKPFYSSTVQYLLKNPAYIGMKEINKKHIHEKSGAGCEYRLVKATWPGIVDKEKFDAVQGLMRENGQTNRNAAEPVRHAYVLGNGILRCGRCDSTMEGRSGTGRLKTTYFYYVCRNKECGLRISADEIEAALLERIKHLAGDGILLKYLIEQTNTKLLKQKPALEKQLQALHKNLAQVKNQANKLLDRWSESEERVKEGFIREKLNDLAGRRVEIEAGIVEVDQALRQIQEQTVQQEEIKKALENIGGIYEQLKPFERRELMGAVLKIAQVNEREITLEIYAVGEPYIINNNVKGNSVNRGEKVRPQPNWLPLLDTFRHQKVDIPFTLSDVKQWFKLFHLSPITIGSAVPQPAGYV